MNFRQKSVAVGGIALMTLMFLFPPWASHVHVGEIQASTPAGYAWLLSPPKTGAGVDLDYPRLLTQLLFLAVGVATLCLTLRKGGLPSGQD